MRQQKSVDFIYIFVLSSRSGYLCSGASLPLSKPHHHQRSSAGQFAAEGDPLQNATYSCCAGVLMVLGS